MNQVKTVRRTGAGAEPPRPKRPGPLRVLAVTVTVAVATLVLAGGAGDRPDPASDPQPRTASCTFTNPAYAGECVETTEIPAESDARKACTVILDCLNNPRCVTVYCKASTLRSGWVLKEAEEL